MTRWGHVALALAVAGCYSDVPVHAGDGVCFVTGSDIDIAGVVTATGSNALAIVATHRLQIESQGALIAGSEPGSPGPGATAVATCAASAAARCCWSWACSS